MFPSCGKPGDGHGRAGSDRRRANQRRDLPEPAWNFRRRVRGPTEWGAPLSAWRTTRPRLPIRRASSASRDLRSTSNKNTKLKSTGWPRSLCTLPLESTINALSFLSASGTHQRQIAVGFSPPLDHHETFILRTRPIPNSPATAFPVVGSDDFTGTSFGGSIASEPSCASGDDRRQQLAADSTATRKDALVPTSPAITVNQTSIHDHQDAISASSASCPVFRELNLGFD